MTTPWKSFYPDVMLHVSGAPQPVVDLALLRATRDFCTQTRAWRLEMDPILLAIGVREYDLPLPNDAEVVRLEDWADINGDRVMLSNEQRSRIECGNTVYTVTGRTVIVNRAPEAVGTLIFNVSLMPSNIAVGAPDDIYGQYVETISMAAVSRLQGQPGKPYSSPADSVRNELLYQDAVDSIKTRLWKGRTTERPRVKPFAF